LIPLAIAQKDGTSKILEIDEKYRLDATLNKLAKLFSIKDE
jgi:hypothetical protein